MSPRTSTAWEELGARQVRRFDNGGRRTESGERKAVARQIPSIDPDIFYDQHPNDFDRRLAENKKEQR
jgi:hypothetical protein